MNSITIFNFLADFRHKKLKIVILFIYCTQSTETNKAHQDVHNSGGPACRTSRSVRFYGNAKTRTLVASDEVDESLQYRTDSARLRGRSEGGRTTPNHPLVLYVQKGIAPARSTASAFTHIVFSAGAPCSSFV